MSSPLRFLITAGADPLYFVKLKGQSPRFSHECARGLVEWAIPLPRLTPLAATLAATLAFLFLGWGTGLLRVHANPFSRHVQAAAASVPHDPIRESFDAARVAAQSGDYDRAVTAMNTATRLLNTVKDDGLRLSTETFENWVAGLQSVEQAGPIVELQESEHSSQVALAELRSSQESAPALPRTRVNLTSSRRLVAGERFGPPPDGEATLDASGLPETAEAFVPTASRLFVDRVWVENLTLVGGRQTLDGIHWRGVKFVNTVIRYQGGETELLGARFINCKFEISRDQRGEQVARYVALNLPALTID